MYPLTLEMVCDALQYRGLIVRVVMALKGLLFSEFSAKTIIATFGCGLVLSDFDHHGGEVHEADTNNKSGQGVAIKRQAIVCILSNDVGADFE
jgi:hypothetical protein